MTWFRVDDGFWSHPKTVDLSDPAVALWVRAGSYSGQHLTDGYIPAARIPLLQGTPQAAYELVVAGLWHEVSDGYQFHDWEQCQETKSQVQARREMWKERAHARRQREASEKAAREAANAKNTSSLSIPFHSPDTRDSTVTSTRESTVDAPADPETVAAVIGGIRSTLRRPQ